MSAGLIAVEVSLLGLEKATFLLCPHMVFSLCTCLPGVSFCVQFPLLVRTPVGLD